MKLITLFLSLFFIFKLSAEDLKKNLAQAETGDWVVISQGKQLTLFHILASSSTTLIIEEVSIAQTLANKHVSSWRKWIYENAPYHNLWAHYQINLKKGTLEKYYSFTEQCYLTAPQTENFLQTLLHLSLVPIPDSLRNKVGLKARENPVNPRPIWQPVMIVDGRVIENVEFDAYETVWPKDSSPISGKPIEIYIPKDKGLYPAYFPYWLQVKGVCGPARVRIIDSGKKLISPKATFQLK